VAFHGDDDGVVSTFILVVEAPFVGMDDDTLEEGWVVVVHVHVVVTSDMIGVEDGMSL